MFQSTPSISVVIPTYNEADNIAELTFRLHSAFETAGVTYELIFIDDHSTDQTVDRINLLARDYPIRLELKRKAKGKAFSLIQGFALARSQYVAMIDADLQYPPEALPNMLELIKNDNADIVVADRSVARTKLLRRFLSKGFRLVFGKLLMGLDVDVQSGMKVFKRSILERIALKPQAWTYDLDFLNQARNAGYRIASYGIEFAKRTAGATKLHVVSATYQIGKAAVKLRLKSVDSIPFGNEQMEQKGKGFHYRGREYVTHNTLKDKHIAVKRTTPRQRFTMVAIILLTALFLLINWHLYLVFLVSSLTILYFCDLLFNLFLIYRSFFRYQELHVDASEFADRQDWPRYSIFCPLYKEAHVLPQFIDAMSKLEYPKDKLEVILLLEEDDTETIASARAMGLPDFFTIAVVPHGMPKTKPKACNFGLEVATGTYAVIYDAEDIPDPLQVKQAVVAFERVGPEIGCIQAKLNYYNWDQNLLTRLFTLEYSLWFNLILTGLQSISAPIPLGGTSNHFRTEDLRSMGGWDPFNVTEDADLGMRIAKRGMRTAILDSTTMEEANSQYGNWLKQRSRWIKGYMQTYLVHMRELKAFSATGKKIDMLTFQLIIGGKILSMLVNPLLWGLTIAYFLFHDQLGGFVQSLYPAPIFYLGIISLIIGNFLYVYYYMMGAVKQHRPELVIYCLFVPLYWLMMSVAAIYGLRDLIVRPFHWHKTKHGLHLKKLETTDAVSS